MYAFLSPCLCGLVGWLGGKGYRCGLGWAGCSGADEPPTPPPPSITQAPAPQRLLDVGCSAGISTRYLKRAFPEAHEVGPSIYVCLTLKKPERSWLAHEVGPSFLSFFLTWVGGWVHLSMCACLPRLPAWGLADLI